MFLSAACHSYEALAWQLDTSGGYSDLNTPDPRERHMLNVECISAWMHGVVNE